MLLCSIIIIILYFWNKPLQIFICLFCLSCEGGGEETGDTYLLESIWKWVSEQVSFHQYLLFTTTSMFVYICWILYIQCHNETNARCLWINSLWNRLSALMFSIVRRNIVSCDLSLWLIPVPKYSPLAQSHRSQLTAGKAWLLPGSSVSLGLLTGRESLAESKYLWEVKIYKYNHFHWQRTEHAGQMQARIKTPPLSHPVHWHCTVSALDSHLQRELETNTDYRW